MNEGPVGLGAHPHYQTCLAGCVPHVSRPVSERCATPEPCTQARDLYHQRDYHEVTDNVSTGEWRFAHAICRACYRATGWDSPSQRDASD